MRHSSVFLALGLCLLLSGSALAGNKEEWKKRTIYQIITDRFYRSNGDTKTGCDLTKYCGGDHDGIVKKLQYIKDLGFDAIWISPVVDNIELDSVSKTYGYHGYWARNWEKLNPHFGDEAALKRLINAAHSMGIWVMADVVANHVGPVGTDYSQIYPFNQASHYHNRCDITDWNNQWQVEQCRLADLPDLNTENSWVRSYLKDWIKKHVQTYGFDGIRIDTICHIEKSFWREYAQSAAVFQIGEALNGVDSYLGDYQKYLDSVLNYPLFYTIQDVFARGQSLRRIADRFNSAVWYYSDYDSTAVFVNNHDQPRFLNINKDWRLLKSALLFGLTSRGIPVFYYGDEQAYAGGNDPQNREPMFANFNQQHEVYKFVQTINKARVSGGAVAATFKEKWVDDNLYAYKKGNLFVAVTNKLNVQVKIDVPNTEFSEGTTLCNIFFPTDCVKISNGKLPVVLNNGEAKVYLTKTNSFFSSKAPRAEEVLRHTRVELKRLRSLAGK